jgi:hypothetical protein
VLLGPPTRANPHEIKHGAASRIRQLGLVAMDERAGEDGVSPLSIYC